MPLNDLSILFVVAVAATVNGVVLAWAATMTPRREPALLWAAGSFLLALSAASVFWGSVVVPLLPLSVVAGEAFEHVMLALSAAATVAFAGTGRGPFGRGPSVAVIGIGVNLAAAPALAAKKGAVDDPLADKARIQAAIDAAYAKYRGLTEGANADYIPALAKVDAELFGIVLVTTDGQVFTAGDVGSEVSIQSISKVFTMARVMDERGPEAIRDNMGVDATGQVFNSIVAVEQYKGAEMNAMVNPGAITATSAMASTNRPKAARINTALVSGPSKPNTIGRTRCQSEGCSKI